MVRYQSYDYAVSKLSSLYTLFISKFDNLHYVTHFDISSSIFPRKHSPGTATQHQLVLTFKVSAYRDAIGV